MKKRLIKITLTVMVCFCLLSLAACSRTDENGTIIVSNSQGKALTAVLKCFPKGMYDSNSYVFGQSGEGVVIDAGAEPQGIVSYTKKVNLKIKYIILTHGHGDHIIQLEKLKETLSAKVLIHENDADLLVSKPDVILKGGETLKVGELKLEIIHTPGHSPGSICIKAGDILFSGDTLFKNNIGKYNLSGGSYDDIINSVKNKLMKLDDSVKVYPGHGKSTTIGYARKHNPYLK